jgi:hypothetical protein
LATLGHDFAVTFDRDAFVFKGKLTEQIGNRGVFGTPARGTIEYDREHGG